jgi:alkylated DNA nucleotide flippase Atl1
MSGVVEALGRKPAKGAAMEPCDELVCHERWGIDGDRAAQPDSARQVLLVDGGVLDEIGLPRGGLRENVTVAGLDLDQLSSGTALALGEVQLRLTVVCDPCAAIGHYADLDHSRVHRRRGMLGVVAAGGRVRRGDVVADLGVAYEPIPDAVLRRCEWVARRVPPGEVLTFDQVRRAIGMAKGYVRTMPRHVRRLMDEGAPAHRLVPGGQGAAVDAEQAAALRAEGVAVGDDGRVDQLTPWRFVEPFYAPARWVARNASTSATRTVRVSGGIESSSTER